MHDEAERVGLLLTSCYSFVPSHTVFIWLRLLTNLLEIFRLEVDVSLLRFTRDVDVLYQKNARQPS
jgi:hypothetical protein